MMMKEMCSAIYKNLNKKCKGKVTVVPYKEQEDCIVVTITMAGEVFATYVDNIENRMLYGMNSRVVCEDILVKYKSYLLSKYFA